MMAVQVNLLPSHSVKTLGAMKAERIVKHITFNPTEANPSTTLYVSIPKLNEHEVIVQEQGYNRGGCGKRARERYKKKKYHIMLDHQVLTDHGVFYPQALYNNLNFESTLSPASQIVRGSDESKLVYKLTNIQLEYKVIRSKHLADEATSTYTYGKEFAFDHVMLSEVVEFNRGTESLLNLRMNPQRRSLKGVLLLFIGPTQQAPGTLKTISIQTLPKWMSL